MTTRNKQAIATFFEALGRGDGERMASVLADGAQARAMGTGAFSITRDRDEIVAAAGMLKSALPDGIAFTITNMIEEDDRIVAEVEGRSCLADGTRYDNSYAFVATMRDGKIAHLNEYYCTLLVENVLVPFVAAQTAQQSG